MNNISFEVINSGKSFYEFLIQGKSFKIKCGKEKFSTIRDLVVDLGQALKSKNNSHLSNILQQNRSHHLKTCLKIISALYKNEFRIFVLDICDLFVKNKIAFNTNNISRFIMTNDLSLSFSGENTAKNYFLQYTELKLFVNEYLNELLKMLESALLNFKRESVWEIVPLFNNEFLFHSLTHKLKEYFNLYVENIGKEFKDKMEIVYPQSLCSYSLYGMFDARKTWFINRHYRKMDIFQTVADDVQQFIINNPTHTIDFNSDHWILRYKNIQSVRTYKINFNEFSISTKNEVKQYLIALINANESVNMIRRRLDGIKQIYLELTNLPYDPINSFLEINYFHVEHLLLHFQQLTNDAGTNKYKLGTIRGFFTEVKLLIDWLGDYYQLENIDNPFRKKKFRNSHSFEERIGYIPESVITQLENHLHLASKTVQNIWLIMMNTGMRISDALSLEADCLEFDQESNLCYLKYNPHKPKQTRANKGLDYHKVPIPVPIIEVIKKQIKETQDLRRLSDSNKIFLTARSNKLITQPTGGSVQGAINSIIKKNNITDETGKIFYYSHHMCRKTLVMELIEKGLSIKEIADYVAHESYKTTEYYYADLQIKKIGELDAKMFDQLFSETLDDEIQSQFSQQEKGSLFNEIKLGARETPEGHGVCVKHVSFGPCQKKKCVGCKMLLTGPQKLPMWRKLYNEQKEYIGEMESEYTKAGIMDFKDHRLYHSEIHLLEIYNKTIKKIEDFAEKRGIYINE
ncbi:tyrosine-type recombinase/integrase [Neobacillus vireti]|uniref:tyrosine-type recombinase/integrase n=1 Tax=Neobacillus vireti TaxID=220686 RepID=UPI003000139F